jgi:DNA-3-methyladenine glycosylase
MFGPPGRWYVYRIHQQWCINLVSGPVNFPEAALIRALLPLEGVGRMMERRNRHHLLELCSGPGKLCQAFGIDGSMNGGEALSGPLRLEADGYRPSSVLATTRIGISRGRELSYRFLEAGSPFVSKPPAKTEPPTTHG